ncbi:MAG: cysteine desulfurase, partial [Proteobacteria bacterium]|nr:cysteine desulfurase [Pseudomonadota bacterium]
MNAIAYLDHNATTPPRPAVSQAVTAALTLGGNASAVHRLGRLARRKLEEARERVANLVGGAARVVFTGGGTEANNLAMRGCHRALAIVSAVEHLSVLDAVPAPVTVGVDGTGVVDLGDLENRLAAAERPAMVSIMLANNETGVIQPVAEAARLAHARGALIHCDAVQAGGKLALDFTGLGVDYLTLSAHKMGGPQGVGALIMGADAPLEPILRGGGQERGARSGTENVAGITGFGLAARIAGEEIGHFDEIRILRDGLERDLVAMAPEAKIIGAETRRLPNTSCISLAGLEAETQVMALDLENVCIGSGAA